MAAVRVGVTGTLVADLDPGATDPIVLEVDPFVDQAAVEEESVLGRPDHPIQVRAVVHPDLADDGGLGAGPKLGAKAPAIWVFRAAGLRRAGPIHAEPPDTDPIDV